MLGSATSSSKVVQLQEKSIEEVVQNSIKNAASTATAESYEQIMAAALEAAKITSDALNKVSTQNVSTSKGQSVDLNSVILSYNHAVERLTRKSALLDNLIKQTINELQRLAALFSLSHGNTSSGDSSVFLEAMNKCSKAVKACKVERSAKKVAAKRSEIALKHNAALKLLELKNDQIQLVQSKYAIGDISSARIKADVEKVQK